MINKNINTPRHCYRLRQIPTAQEVSHESQAPTKCTKKPYNLLVVVFS